jgi:hypothetical protein
LKIWTDHELTAAGLFQSINPLQDIRGLHARCPDLELTFDDAAIFQSKSFLVSACHMRVQAYFDPQALEPLPRSSGDAFGKCGQKPLAAIQEDDSDQIRKPLDAITARNLRQRDEFGGKLDAGRPAADNPDAHLPALRETAKDP